MFGLFDAMSKPFMEREDVQLITVAEHHLPLCTVK